ncbi:MAG: hypothetical protein FWD40_08960 [Treponema sp.]|nr:hypothetical protein [Treponema sp.]
MSNNEVLVSVRKFFLQEQNKNKEKEIIKIMLQENISVVCVNREQQKKRLMPFNSLYGSGTSFWLQKHSWDYFISEKDKQKIEELTNNSPVVLNAGAYSKSPEVVVVQQAEISENNAMQKDDNSDTLSSGSKEVQDINNHANKINKLIENKTNDPKVISNVLVNAVNDTAAINQNIMMDAAQYSDSEAKNLTQNMVNSTMAMVKASLSIPMEGVSQDELINSLAERSQNPIMKHMIRSYTQGIAFFEYFNRLMSSSYVIAKLRIEFKKKYLPLYTTLLPHFDHSQLTLERVFNGGLREIPPHLINNWSAGLLLHDVGKKTNIEYKEGENNYDHKAAIDHVRFGMSSIINKTNYCKEAAFITGYHHDYYGNNGSYGIYSSYLNNFRKKYPGKFQDFCIGFELENLVKCEVLAYFPAKVLEIIDTYDSLTDTSRVSSKILSHNEAIDTMWNLYIIRYRRLDPILFDIFVKFRNAKEYFKYG